MDMVMPARTKTVKTQDLLLQNIKRRRRPAPNLERFPVAAQLNIRLYRVAHDVAPRPKIAVSQAVEKSQSDRVHRKREVLGLLGFNDRLEHAPKHALAAEGHFLDCAYS
jgi:hypothetical protein